MEVEDTPTSAGADEPPRGRYSALRARLTRSEAQLHDKYHELEARRGQSEPIDIAFRIAEADRRISGGLIAGGMAFRIYVVLVPFAFVLVTVFGLLGKAVDPSDPVSLAKDLGMTGLVASSINASADASLTQQIVTLLLAFYALTWSTWNMIRALRAVHGLAWDLHELPRLTHTWRWILYSIAAFFAAFLAEFAVSRLSDSIDPLAELVVRLLSVVAITGASVGLSLALPRAAGTTWRALVPGALVIGIGAWILQLLTVYFFSRYIASKSDTYGALGASIAILLWAYLLGRLTVTAAFLNAERWRRQHPADR